MSQAPDLVVQFSAIPRRGVITEATISIEATVRNGGADDAPASTLRFYRSADATITTSDTALGTAAVAQLAGAATASARLAVTVPATPGTYYYGACVDAVAGEADSTNNCSTAAQVEVVERPLPPDLVVEHAGVTPSSVDAGDRFVITVTVRNGGTGDSPVSLDVALLLLPGRGHLLRRQGGRHGLSSRAPSPRGAAPMRRSS